MKLDELNARIAALPITNGLDGKLGRDEAMYLAQERFGILGVLQGQEPTEEQVGIVAKQLGLDEL